MITSLLLAAAFAFEQPHLVPAPAKAEWRLDTCVELTEKTRFEVKADEPSAEWLRKHLKSAFGLKVEVVGGEGAAATEGVAGGVGGEGAAATGKDGAYLLEVKPGRVTVSAADIAGVRHAFQTLRQIALPKRGTLKTEGWIAPACTIDDAPAMAFRGTHLCWFPETRPSVIERAIRLAALYKMNYVVIETWGAFRSEKYPWWGWKDGTMTKAELKRLRDIADDLGVTLVPQLNIFGHASLSRVKSAKHAVLDLTPEYAPLFEPHRGWNWCLTNPEALKVIDGLAVELHEAFGNPPYFHIGCDEAEKPSCPTCRATDYTDLVASNIVRVVKLMEKRGARSMMWHDMLLKKGAWGRFYANAEDGSERLIGMIPKSVIICDWFYNEGVSPEGYPTYAYFRQQGFDVLCSPWESISGTAAQAKAAHAAGAMGLLGTTWHHLYNDGLRRQFVPQAAGAWGTPADMHGFPDHWRMVGNDAGISDYDDCGWAVEQVPNRPTVESPLGL